MSDLRQEVLSLIQKEQRFLTKREIVLELGIKGAKRIALKQLLLDLKREGLYGKGVLYANAMQRFHRLPDKTNSKSRLGIFTPSREGGWLEPCHRKDTMPPIRCSHDSIKGLKTNDVVYFTLTPLGEPSIQEVVGNLNDPKVFSLMAIHAHHLPFQFNQESLQLAEKAKIPPLGNRRDLRHIPLVTIDGEDARDFDDAVYACPDTDHGNIGGWKAIVAIADVAYYVRPGDALDQTAYERGNSVYFADRVVPMLPETLSNGLCSLNPNEDRACLAVELAISPQGGLKKFRFYRALMRSKARLTYTQVQNAIEGNLDSTTLPLWDEILSPLYGVYKALRKARENRGSLELEGFERTVIFDPHGRIQSIQAREHLQSHELIEELMIAANVAAAKALSAKKWPTLYRVHDKPDAERVENLRRVIKAMRIDLPKIKKMTPQGFNSILKAKTPFKRLIHDLVLRSQSQAKYTPENIGHYGLGLTHYTHFTSPIRRYADLMVHRALIAALELGEAGQDMVPYTSLQVIGDHISSTERKAAQLEREVMDRYLVLYLENQIGKVFESTIVGVNNQGIFISLENNGAQGFIHKAQLPGDFYYHDADTHRYVGRRTHRAFQLGDMVTVLLEAADSRTSATQFSILISSLEDKIPSRKKNKIKKKDENESNLVGKREKMIKNKKRK